MRLYTVHVPAIEPGRIPPGEKRRERQLVDMMPIKEGFCWPAFFFSVVWSLWHRLWLVTMGLVAINLAASAVVFQTGANEVVNFVIIITIALLLGYMANDFRRAKLERQGYSERGVVLAGTAGAAVERYLDARSWAG